MRIVPPAVNHRSVAASRRYIFVTFLPRDAMLAWYAVAVSVRLSVRHKPVGLLYQNG